MVKRISHQMDMIFTHFGVSGPAALRCSQFVYKEQKESKETGYCYAIGRISKFKSRSTLSKN